MLSSTVTALLAALVSGSVDSLQVALAHLFFNLTGILIWYPIPFMRRIPLRGAVTLGKLTRVWRGFPLLYIAVCFFLIPLFFFGLSSLYMGAAGLVALAILLTIAVVAGVAYTLFWCYKKDGKKKTIDAFATRQRKQEAIKSLPDDMETLQSEVEYLKRKIELLVEHTGAPDDEEVDDVEKQELLAKTEDKESTADDSEIANEIQT